MERDGDRRCADQTGHGVTHVGAPLHRHAAGLTGQPDEAAGRARDDVGCLAVLPLGMEPKRCHRALDQTRVDGPKCVVAQPERVEVAGAFGVDQHVGVGDQRQEPFRLGRDIEQHRALVCREVLMRERRLDRVDTIVPRREPTDRVAFRWLDHHDLRAKIGQHPARKRP